MEKIKKPKEKTAPGAIRNGFDNSVKNTQTKRFSDLFHFRLNGRKPQCRKCRSFVGALSKDDLCFDCDQRGEYVWREVLTQTERAEILRGTV